MPSQHGDCPFRSFIAIDQMRLKRLRPKKGRFLHRLILSIDRHGVVRPGAAKIPPPLRMSGIAVGARVDQEFARSDLQLHGQGIGMTVRVAGAMPNSPWSKSNRS